MREIRTEENEFPYRNPMTEVLGNREIVLDHYRERWYLREDKRKEFLEKRRVHYANREAFRRASYYDPEVERVQDMMWEDWVTLWYERLQWDIGYDPEVPEKFPNYRRRDDEDEGGPGAGPWNSSMALTTPIVGEGLFYSGQVVQTYGIHTEAPGASKGHTLGQRASASRMTGGGEVNKDREGGPSKPNRQPGESGEDAGAGRTSGSKSSDKGKVDWKI